MPKSKRVKLVSLTKTTKRNTRESKQALIDEVRECIDQYKNIIVFEIINVQSKHLNEVRKEFRKDGRLFLTKNKVLANALGKTQEEEYKENLHKVAQTLHNLCGLLFTNKSREEVLKFISSMKRPEFARQGQVVNETIEIKQGPIEWMPFSMEERCRKLNLPVIVKDGIIHFLQDYTVCKSGDTLTGAQSKILRLFGYKLAEFSMKVKCIWSNGQFEEFS